MALNDESQLITYLMDKEVECMQSYTNNYIGKNSYRYCYQALAGLFQANHPANFEPLDYSLDGDHPDDSRLQGSSENGIEMVDYMLSNSSVPQTQISLDKLSFADVMQFADFGPKLAVLNQSKMSEDENYHALLPLPALPAGEIEDGLGGTSIKNKEVVIMEDRDGSEKGRLTSENITSQQLHLVDGVEKTGTVEVKSRRKRPRSMKTSEEVESQRMTHIAVERNRRRQMNEHLRVLRSLMPGSYVQRGDQASIIGGAIEFVRELEQLVSCLESQKRRRLHASTEAQRTDSTPSTVPIQQAFYPYLPLPDSDNAKLLDLHQGSGFREEMAENKSYLADIEVRLLGLDAVIKILSRRRPGQLIKTIAALEELQLSILHTNITTIEQTVLYSFNIKITGEARYTAEDMANSVQRILSFIDANTL